MPSPSPSTPNTCTFYFQEPVEEIPPERLLILDHYAFDAIELKAYFENAMENVSVNPHTNKTFSKEAIDILRGHPTLGTFIKELEEKTRHQDVGIQLETIDAVMQLLLAIHARGLDSSDKAREIFLEHHHSLTDEAQKQLDNYVISVPSLYGGFQRMTFAAALQGGHHSCAIILQTFLWCFVIHMRPSALDWVPPKLETKSVEYNMSILASPYTLSREQLQGYARTFRAEPVNRFLRFFSYTDSFFVLVRNATLYTLAFFAIAPYTILPLSRAADDWIMKNVKTFLSETYSLTKHESLLISAIITALGQTLIMLLPLFAFVTLLIKEENRLLHRPNTVELSSIGDVRIPRPDLPSPLVRHSLWEQKCDQNQLVAKRAQHEFDKRWGLTRLTLR